MSTDVERVETPWGLRIGLVLLGLLLAGVFLLPPVRSWINSIPYFFEVFYVVLTVVAAALVVWSAYTHQGTWVVGTWALFFWAAACSAVYIFGGARIFFLLGRGGAIAFLVAEALIILFPARQEPRGA